MSPVLSLSYSRRQHCTKGPSPQPRAIDKALLPTSFLLLTLHVLSASHLPSFSSHCLPVFLRLRPCAACAFSLVLNSNEFRTFRKPQARVPFVQPRKGIDNTCAAQDELEWPVGECAPSNHRKVSPQACTCGRSGCNIHTSEHVRSSRTRSVPFKRQLPPLSPSFPLRRVVLPSRKQSLPCSLLPCREE